MSKSKKLDLKTLASKVSQSINETHRANKALVLDESSAVELTASRYLALPEHLNKALGTPGLPFGQITQVYGKKDSGKSSLLMQSMVACQQQDVLSVLILSEHKFDASRMEKFMGSNTDGIIVVPVEDLEEGFTVMDRMLADLANGFMMIGGEKFDMAGTSVFFFWDSIGGTVSGKELDYEIADHDKDMGRFAKSLKSMVKKIWQRLKKTREQAGVFLLNQVWDDRTPTGITTERPYGGQSVQHYYALEVHLKKKTAIKMQLAGQYTEIGYNIELRVQKNHLSPIRRRTPLAVVASGLIPQTGINDFKKKYQKLLREL